MSDKKNILDLIERSRTIVLEIMKFGVNEECIARIIQGLAMESEDPDFTKKILEVTKTKINRLQSVETDENNLKTENKKLIL
jgi:hypothetical protein